MSNTLSDNTPLYGLAYQKLQTTLFKQRKYGEMRLSTYLSTRMGVEGWTFSAADIAHQTGINRNTAYALCNLLVKAGIFVLKEEKRGCATIYSFDKTGLLNYLQGDIALDGLSTGTCLLDKHLPPISTSTSTCLLDTHLPASSPSTSGLLDEHLPANPTSTTINIKNEEEKEYIQTNRAYVCISHSQDAESKTHAFINHALTLQASNPDLGIIIKANAQQKLTKLFSSEPYLSAEELAEEWLAALNDASYCKMLISVDDPDNYNGTKVERGEFDEHFWTKRSCDLTFFVNNRANVLAHLN